MTTKLEKSFMDDNDRAFALSIDRQEEDKSSSYAQEEETNDVISNQISLEINVSADLCPEKNECCIQISGGEHIVYSMTAIPAESSQSEDMGESDKNIGKNWKTEISEDGGDTFHSWEGKAMIGTLDSGQSKQFLIREKKEEDREESIVNTVVITSEQGDSKLQNKIETEERISLTLEKVDKFQAVTDIIQSIALQESALAHILNAEGEKLQLVIARENVTLEQVLEINNSVKKMVSAVTRLELLLQKKLSLCEGKSFATCS